MNNGKDDYVVHLHMSTSTLAWLFLAAMTLSAVITGVAMRAASNAQLEVCVRVNERLMTINEVCVDIRSAP